LSEIRHLYKPKPLTSIFIALVFAGCAEILTKVALHNTQGVILNRFIELSVKNTTIFYWCLAGALGVYTALTLKNEIVLTETGFSVPKNPIGNNIVTVNYVDITHVVPISV
jgi:hypothetical protein